MLHEADLHLAERIAAIETRGSAHLLARGRHAAIGRALAVAAPLLLPVPILSFAAGWFAPLRWWIVLAAALLVPTLAFVGVMAREMHRLRVRREDAIALFDRALTLKDRVAATDEFLRDAANPFKAAAVREAEPWIVAASDTALPPAPTARIATRWRFAAIGLALLVATAAQQYWMPATRSSSVERVLARAGIADPRAPDSAVASVAGSDDRRATNSGSGAGTQPIPAPGGAGADRAGAASEGAGGEAGGAGQVGNANAAAAPDMWQGANAANARTAGRAGAGDPGGRGGANEAVAGGQDGQARSADGARGDRAAGDREATAASRGATKASSASANQPGAAPPLSGQQRPQPGNGGNADGKQRSSREQSEGPTQPGQGKGQGRNGERSGQDSLKRANGIAAMLLVVPMTDRLGGSANPGPVISQPRRVPPHAGRAGDVAAGNRGVGSGDAGRLPHRPASAQERRIVRDYFRPREASR